MLLVTAQMPIWEACLRTEDQAIIFQCNLPDFFDNKMPLRIIENCLSEKSVRVLFFGQLEYQPDYQVFS